MPFFFCSECEVRISREVEELEDDSKLCKANEEQHLPEGKYKVSDDDYWLAEGDYLINQKDTLNLEIDGEWGNDISKHYGCCGLDGNSGLNSKCKNGHLLATKITECNMPHTTILNKEKVELRKNRK